jgi:hypothetical protein
MAGAMALVPPAWERAHRQLTLALQAYLQEPEAIEFVTATADAGRNVYVQFALIDGGLADRLAVPRNTLTGETTGSAFLDPPGSLPAGAFATLTALGWAIGPGSDASGNFSRSWQPPYDLASIAAEGIRALAEGYGIAPLPELHVASADREFTPESLGIA